MGKINKKITRQSSMKFQAANKFTCETIECKSEKLEESENIEMKEEISEEVEKTIQPQQQNDKNDVKPVGRKEARKMKKKKKMGFYEKVAKSRIEKGMIILPQKIETKIYKLKKALRKKGIDDAEIRDIIRKKRREEELALRKEQKTLCFKCRKPGHSLTNCPEANDQESSVDICYFCGSTEHILSECSKHKISGKKKQQNLPYAKCFICKQTGHLASSCSENEKGVYPKGGNCRICGSIKHLVKDCSQNKDKGRVEEEISLKTLADVNCSVDADDFEITSQVTKLTNPKRVKF